MTRNDLDRMDRMRRRFQTAQDKVLDVLATYRFDKSKDDAIRGKIAVAADSCNNLGQFLQTWLGNRVSDQQVSYNRIAQILAEYEAEAARIEKLNRRRSL